MAWVERDEADACCDGLLGAVGNDEEVARLLHSGCDPDGDPFPGNGLLPPKSGCCFDVCGAAEGLSAIRVDGLSDDEIRERANLIAPTTHQPDRFGRGALVAQASVVRGIRLPTEGDRQIVFIYDDPTLGEERHVVLRIVEGLSRGRQSEVRAKLKSAFNRRVTP